MKPDVTVIIVSWNTRDYLRQCLASLRTASAAPQRLRVCVVDNGSTDGTVEMVRTTFPEVCLDAAGENLGFARANNRALRDCRTEYALLLNPDTEVHPGAIDRLVAFLEREPRAGAVGPMLLNADGTLQKAGDAFPTLAREILCVPGLRSLRWLDGWRRRLTFQRDAFDQVAEVDGVLGACVLVRRAVWEQIGLLDERFFMYYEEIDWYRRMRAAGWRVFYLPEAVVTHHGGKSSGQRGLAISRIYFRSRYLYFRKHHGVAQAILIALLNGALLLGAEGKARLRRPAVPPARPAGEDSRQRG